MNRKPISRISVIGQKNQVEQEPRVLQDCGISPLAIESSPDFHYAYPVLPHESFSESRPPHGATECGLYEERAMNDEIVSSHETIINR